MFGMVYHFLIALFVIAAPPACTARQDQRPDPGRGRESAAPARSEVAKPMESFARLVGGEWKLKAPGMTSHIFDTWHWGPGRHSIRLLTEGTNAADGNSPWRRFETFYWHPGRNQVCLLGLSSFGRGVSEGTIKFEGDRADGVFDLYQTSGHRKMGLRWIFDGPDSYHDVLLEGTPEGLKVMNEWDHVRAKTLSATRPHAAGEVPKHSERLGALESLLGPAWEATGAWAGGDALHVRSSVEWVPYADVIYARVLAPSKDGEPTHLLDVYLYSHTGANVLRCLALSERGGVYEGDVTVLDGGALQAELKGYERDQLVRQIVRCDLESDGTLRQRVWSLADDGRTLLLDIRHKQLGPRKD